MASSSSISSSSLRVGEWLVDPGGHALTRGDETVRVEPKVMALLVFLVEREGDTVSREEILDTVWPDVIVSDDALSRVVSKLRRALDDDASAPRYVETIPKAGYRLIAPVSRPPAEPVASPAETPAESPVEKPAGAAPPTVARAERSPWSAGPRVLAAGLVVALVVAGLLWLRAPEGEPALVSRRLTHLPGVETHPALAPDGQLLAFVAVPRGGTGAELYVQGIDDPAPRRLTETPGEERHPAWGPGGQLAYLRCVERQCAIYATAAVGGGVRRLTDATVGPWGLAWSRDGRVLVAGQRPEPAAPYRLVRIDAVTGDVEALTTADHADLFPAISPDGTLVAFVRHGDDGEEDVVVQPLAPDAPARPLTDEGHPVDGLAWDGDEAVIAAINRGDGAALWRLPVAGGPPERLPLATASAPRRPTAAGGRIVFEARSEETNLYRVPLSDEGPAEPILVSTDATTQPTLHPDGSRVAFVSDRSGTPELWTARLDGSGLMRLTSFGGARLGAPAWSPDGRTIAFEAQHEGQATIYGVSPRGGDATPLVEAEGYAAGPRWSADGRHLYFGLMQEGGWQVWRVAAEGGAPEQVTTAGAFVGEPAPGGGALLFSRENEPGLWRMPLPTGPPVRIDSTMASSDWGNWDVTPDGVYLVDRTGATPRLIHLDLATLERTVVRDDLRTLSMREPGLALSGDGRFLVAVRTDLAESALVLVEPASSAR